MGAKLFVPECAKLPYNVDRPSKKCGRIGGLLIGVFLAILIAGGVAWAMDINGSSTGATVGVAIALLIIVILFSVWIGGWLGKRTQISWQSRREQFQKQGLSEKEVNKTLYDLWNQSANRGTQLASASIVANGLIRK